MDIRNSQLKLTAIRETGWAKDLGKAIASMPRFASSGVNNPFASVMVNGAVVNAGSSCLAR